MSSFNFSNVLGGAAFGSLNAFLSHNASKDGYSKPNRYEVIIGLPSGALSSPESSGLDASATTVRLSQMTVVTTYLVVTLNVALGVALLVTLKTVKKYKLLVNFQRMEKSRVRLPLKV